MDKERPILFNSEMVNAILAGKKTQTRRVIKNKSNINHAIECPYGKPGDLLWVRETWRPEELDSGNDGIRFRADAVFKGIDNTQAAAEKWFQVYSEKENWKLWRPSIFMPRWASRITLEITHVRVERVQYIKLSGAKAEGVEHDYENNLTTIENFAVLWDSINKKRGFGWDENPWVWVIEWRVKHATPNN